MRFVFFALCMLVLGMGGPMGAPAPASAAEGVGRIPTELGPGVKSCVRWMEERQIDGAAAWQYQQWLLGYVSAYNRWIVTGKDVTAGQTATGLFNWIDGYCRENPMTTFANATDALIEHLNTRQ